MGVAVGLAVIAVPFVVKPAGRTCVRFLSVTAPILVLIQILLGAASVWTQLGVVAVTAHLGGAALLWACLVSLVTLTPSPSPGSGRGELRPIHKVEGEGAGVRA